MAKKQSAFPKVIKIGIYDYKVATEPNSFAYNGRLLDGLIHFDDLNIVLNSGLAEQRTEQILAHEIMHGIIKHHDVPIDENSEEFEEIVNKLAIGMLQILKDNPDLFRR